MSQRDSVARSMVPGADGSSPGSPPFLRSAAVSVDARAAASASMRLSTSSLVACLGLMCALVVSVVEVSAEVPPQTAAAAAAKNEEDIFTSFFFLKGEEGRRRK